MKLRSVIWTYLMLSILYFTNANIDMQLKSPESISPQDKKANVLDSVFAKMTFNERIQLLSITGLKNGKMTVNSDLRVNSNGFLFDPKTNSRIPEKLIPDTLLGFEHLQLRIIYADSNLLSINNLTIGQTNETKLAQYNQAIQSENLKKDGFNITLGNFFQTYNSKTKNQRIAFTQSPLSSEKYWQSTLEGAEENGIKMGITDPFMLDISIDTNDIKEFQAIGLSGNRYYSRRGHDIIQMNNNFIDYKTRINDKGAKSEQEFLRDNFKFDGLIISPDFSSLKNENQAIKAIESIKNGTDIVCISANYQVELDSLLSNYFKMHEKALKKSCYKVLGIKYDLNKRETKKTDFSKFNSQFEYQVKQASISCVENDFNILPIKNLNQSTYYYTSTSNGSFFQNQLDHYVSSIAADKITKNSTGICIIDGFNDNLEQSLKWANSYQGNLKLILVTDQINALKNRVSKFDSFSGIIIAGDNSKLSQEIALQAIFGAYAINGKLPFYLTPKFPMGAGIDVKSLSRLSYVDPEFVGIAPDKMMEIDKIVESGISAKAFPGCQVLVGVEGKIVYEKAFGYQDFSHNSKIDQRTIYDIASITKIAASTSSLMKLQGDNLFSLDKTLGDYLPELVGNTEFANIKLKDMMAHQAGLPAWIPFYLKTLSGGKPNPYYYSKIKTDEYSVPVAKDLWIRNYYPDTIYDRILSSRLKSKSYLYSDLGYYFVKKIIEKQSKEKMEDYVYDSIYRKLGLQSMTYNPYLKFDLSRIAPTENDNIFRKQLVHGYVHDPGSAMMGGVGGHAGIFSTANDLAILMQMMLNGGNYGGVQILKKEVLDEYTAVQFPNSNRRGAGFDKPNLNGTEATACAMASPVSYGHSGFTGTLVWVDPKYKINYVFLSNRVYPDAENWKIVKMDIRTRIQTKIYQAVQSSSNFNFLQ